MDCYHAEDNVWFSIKKPLQHSVWNSASASLEEAVWSHVWVTTNISMNTAEKSIINKLQTYDFYKE